MGPRTARRFRAGWLCVPSPVSYLLACVGGSWLWPRGYQGGCATPPPPPYPRRPASTHPAFVPCLCPAIRRAAFPVRAAASYVTPQCQGAVRVLGRPAAAAPPGCAPVPGECPFKQLGGTRPLRPALHPHHTARASPTPVHAHALAPVPACPCLLLWRVCSPRWPATRRAHPGRSLPGTSALQGRT